MIGHWLGYEDRLKEEIGNYVRRYRYTGSFLVYLYRTLYYIGKSLRPLYTFSLDEATPNERSRKIDHFVGQSILLYVPLK